MCQDVNDEKLMKVLHLQNTPTVVRTKNLTIRGIHAPFAIARMISFQFQGTERPLAEKLTFVQLNDDRVSLYTRASLKIGDELRHSWLIS